MPVAGTWTGPGTAAVGQTVVYHLSATGLRFGVGRNPASVSIGDTGSSGPGSVATTAEAFAEAPIITGGQQRINTTVSTCEINYTRTITQADYDNQGGSPRSMIATIVGELSSDFSSMFVPVTLTAAPPPPVIPDPPVLRRRVNFDR